MQLWETSGSCCKARPGYQLTAAQIRGCTWKFKALSSKMIQTNKTRSCDRPAYCNTPIANSRRRLADFKVNVAQDFMFALQSTGLLSHSGLFRRHYIQIFSYLILLLWYWILKSSLLLFLSGAACAFLPVSRRQSLLPNLFGRVNFGNFLPGKT